ncbi:MAG: glycosyltransferase, partial [Bdellovibrionota bacterium]
LSDKNVPVRALGYVPDSELAQLYLDSFALLAPSWHEGFGLPVVEAMSVGLPALVSAKASLPEIAGAAARSIAPEDPASWAAAMLALENDSENYAMRAQAALERGRFFSWDATAVNVLDFVEQLPPTATT